MDGPRVGSLSRVSRPTKRAPAKDFVARKKAEGKSWREALRALKRHLARAVFRILSQPVGQASSLGA